ncbi:pentatricopeptide repeat-containing protein At3g22470, mitochondrial-like [Papaver somniferum]|uniref:pentatricopeptide repeat-containing protein At3g22470, mitochondrial-like n=1 Tax=Papaver somniferum TaxID=3469 RepID=UPI000E705515|nr:pentatricopeptide repeat-containing protein At3g22470, mitochondrial-like [Papaver somniferum]
MLDGLVLVGMHDEAVQLFQALETTKGLETDTVSFNTMIHGYCRKDMLEEAMLVFSRMKQREIRPTAVTYNTLLWGLYQVGRITSAERFFEEFLASGVSPNHVTHHIKLTAYCKNGKMGEAVKLVESLVMSDDPYFTEFYNTLMHGFCLVGELENALHLFHEILTKGLMRDVVSYNTMIGSLFHHRRSLEAENLVSQMEVEGCVPNSRTYDIIISGFLRGSQTEKGVQYFHIMRQRGFVPADSVVAFYIQ